MYKIILADQVDELSPYIEDHIIRNIKNKQIDKFECHLNGYLLSFYWYDILNITQEPIQVIIYFTDDDLFFLCENEECLNKVKAMVKEETSDEKTLYSFFIALINGDTDYLEELEELITDTEDNLLTSHKKECTADILGYRRLLLRLKRYYEQLNKIFEGLVDNENDIISEEHLRYFRILDGRIDRLFAHVLNLRDYVTQVREAYQAQIDIEQNSLMKTFTVVTAIFLPLTLLVGWYGMNLKMPEFTWNFGYPMVIGISILIVIVCIICFKHKKWF
ncbi:CorA family divalent cation transporter [Paludicola sp. MB14-C6]|uniref:CorA family divalent cation transporter n=1 Tax=Paludihabitans sp. MB14-C6 TaxID=3070656 RepID=UPI0027DE9018|nr:CorA family divalent cation transporter [Paludicola sp. MB14-C6]WMJ22513.1 CorA family divalent cation transporter [Paludicola sp. MB14-C6]